MIASGTTVQLKEAADNLDPRGDDPLTFEAEQSGMVVGHRGDDPVIRWRDGTYGVVRSDQVVEARPTTY
jgi:hypothetical protein